MTPRPDLTYQVREHTSVSKTNEISDDSEDDSEDDSGSEVDDDDVLDDLESNQGTCPGKSTRSGSLHLES